MEGKMWKPIITSGPRDNKNHQYNEYYFAILSLCNSIIYTQLQLSFFVFFILYVFPCKKKKKQKINNFKEVTFIVYYEPDNDLKIL